MPLGQGDDDLYIEDESMAVDQAWLAQALPELYPSVPSRGEQTFSLNLFNPFTINETNRHPSLKTTALIPQDGAVNGYIKFRLRTSDVEDQRSPILGKGKGMAILANSFPTNRPQELPQEMQQSPKAPPMYIQYLPPNFGWRLNLDEVDTKLMKFCNDHLAFKMKLI